MKEVEILDVYAKPEEINNGDSTTFYVKLKSNFSGEIELSVRELEGLLLYKGKDVLEKTIKIKSGTSEINLKTKIKLSALVDYSEFEMQLNITNLEISPAPYKFSLKINTGGSSKAA